MTMQSLLNELERRWREMFCALAAGEDLPPARRLRTEGMMEAAALLGAADDLDALAASGAKADALRGELEAIADAKALSAGLEALVEARNKADHTVYEIDKMVKEHGGHSIAVYDTPQKEAMACQLVKEGRVNFMCTANYSKGSVMNIIVKRILDKIKADFEFDRLIEVNQKKAWK